MLAIGSPQPRSGSVGLSGLGSAPLSGYVSYPQLGQGDVVRYSYTEVSDDPGEQVEQVIGLMRGYANVDARSPEISLDIALARETGEPLADTFSYLRRDGGRGMRFVRDEVTSAPLEVDKWNPIVEMLMRPVDQAASSTPQGDCDDFSMYGAAHLVARSIPCSFVTVAADEQDPNAYSHVYLVAYPASGPYAGQRVPMDLSHGPYLGWEVANRFGKRKEWPLSGTDFPVLSIALLASAGYMAWRYMKGKKI